MIEPPQLANSAAQLHAVIALVVPRTEIQHAMAPAISEIIAAVTTQGVGPSGPLFTYHIKMEPGIFNFEVCFPVRAAIVPTGRVQRGTLPAARVARTVSTARMRALAWPRASSNDGSTAPVTRPRLICGSGISSARTAAMM